MKDSEAYKAKKAFFDSLITVYGRNVVLEVLQDETVPIHKLHMAKSNKHEGVIETILELARKRGIEIKEHSKEQLSRISRNAKQDQGVAADIIAPNYKNANDYIETLPESFRLLALDGIHNPQNLGMIIRSAAAGNIDAILLPKKNSAKLSPLVIKASAGTLFKIDILYCETLDEVLEDFAKSGSSIYGLSSHAKESLQELTPAKRTIFVLGNESEGVSREVEAICNRSVSIPMNRGVESLNVAVTAALISFTTS
ncbi:MAG: 23S rRNA (guanosine(2251)-2'-O)-methyltransferase RlmB [Campylobacterota bacterium]|nr:23S rRNA (guanosine(2251)-2'-O)-methyltransferase RlmB [Campylobacterota bacterium]